MIGRIKQNKAHTPSPLGSSGITRAVRSSKWFTFSWGWNLLISKLTYRYDLGRTRCGNGGFGHYCIHSRVKWYISRNSDRSVVIWFYIGCLLKADSFVMVYGKVKLYKPVLSRAKYCKAWDIQCLYAFRIILGRNNAKPLGLKNYCPLVV